MPNVMSDHPDRMHPASRTRCVVHSGASAGRVSEERSTLASSLALDECPTLG